MIQFDTVIGNPPYSGSLHLDIISSVLPFMSERATGCFVHPAKWLIDVRKYGKRGEFGRVNSVEIKKYGVLKKELEGHIKSIDIENLNLKFGTGLNVPFSRTNIDMTKTYKTIDFTCCGEHKTVNSLYDCNLIGDYRTIWSILDKVQTYGDMMKSHITTKEMGDGIYYHKYSEIICAILGRFDSAPEDRMNLDGYSVELKNGRFPIGFVDCSIKIADDNIYDYVPFAKKQGRGKELSTHKANCIYGTKEELENWKYFIFNNKLPLFINIVLNTDQNNVSQDFLPWMVDRHYTDEEINKKFKFTKEEIKFIDDTIKKFEKNSSWLKEFMCGKEDFINISG